MVIIKNVDYQIFIETLHQINMLFVMTKILCEWMRISNQKKAIKKPYQLYVQEGRKKIIYVLVKSQYVI